MKAIQTKYLGATDTKPSRIKASAEGVPSKIYGGNYLDQLADLDHLDRHQRAAHCFALSRNWPTSLVCGGLPDGTYAHCFLPKEKPLDKLQQHVTGKIERGEAEPVVEIPHVPTADNQKHQAYLDYTNNFCTAQGFAAHYGLTEEQGILLIRDGRKIHEARTAKSFTVIAVSSNTNSFGLKSIILVAEDGEAWEILKSAYSDPLPKQGDTIKRAGGVFAIGCECPRRLSDSTPAVAKKIITEAKRK
jgi:hypothetical protein